MDYRKQEEKNDVVSPEEMASAYRGLLEALMAENSPVWHNSIEILKRLLAEEEAAMEAH